ncbi:MAG: hypothetical protein Q8J78_02580, partial [Moraxellaceae bacterium]|nr:hypothetical protein [Moraxellaceae bacterium]
NLYTNKVASGLLNPRNEKMMQLQLAQILQLLAPLYESRSDESYKVILEHPVRTDDLIAIIDIVVEHTIGNASSLAAIELKCFRLYSNNSDTKKRGAQNLGMYDYWADIENLEKYLKLPGFNAAHHLTITDDPYYVNTLHTGKQVKTYSTNRCRTSVTGLLECPIANREGRIFLSGSYQLPWVTKGNFHFIAQAAATIQADALPSRSSINIETKDSP